MSKRGNQEGSIHKRSDGRWVGVLHLGYANGKRQRKYFYGETQREARQQLDQARRDHERGLVATGPTQTVAQYLDSWLRDTAQHTLQPRTYLRYEQLVRLHTVPVIGKVALTRLTAQHLSHLYAQKLAEGLSPRSVQFIHSVLHRALRQAERWNLIGRNPASLVQAPRPKGQGMRPLSPEESLRFQAAARGDALEALWIMAVRTGMRQGELLGLRWADVDWTASRVQVRHTLERTKGHWRLKEPKTAGSRRSVKLPPVVVQALRAHRAHQNEQRLAVGPTWEDHDLVFCGPLGLPLDGRDLDRRYLPLLERAGLPRIRFHDLRHTAATVALAAGVNAKVVQEMLGHASVTITLNVYSHVLPTMQDDAVEKVDRLLEGLVAAEAGGCQPGCQDALPGT
jgi:integrase